MLHCHETMIWEWISFTLSLVGGFSHNFFYSDEKNQPRLNHYILIWQITLKFAQITISIEIIAKNILIFFIKIVGHWYKKFYRCVLSVHHCVMTKLIKNETSQFLTLDLKAR